MWPYKSYNKNELFLKESSSLHPSIDGTKREYNYDAKEESTIILNFMPMGQGFLCWCMFIK